MGRNRRAAQQEAQAAAPTLESTLESTLTIARLDLKVVFERLPELWEHIYAPDVRHRDQAEQEHVPHTVRTGSPALWLDPTLIQRVYHDVTAKFARAHYVLGHYTDVPEFWTVMAEVAALTGPRAHTVELSELVTWTRVLHQSLEWLQGQDTQDFRPPEVNAIMEAADHIRSARERIDKLWPPHEKKRRCVMPDCKGGDGKPRVLESDDGKACGACRTRKWRKGKNERTAAA